MSGAAMISRVPFSAARLTLTAVVGISGGLRAEPAFEQEPIRYSESAAHDKAALLAERLARGEVVFDRGGGEKEFLRSVLREFGVDPATQVLVFSRTSLQADNISPARPRALYFSDDCYIGWVRGGNIELIVTDAALGPVYYLLQMPVAVDDRPTITRDGDCLRCHVGHNPQRVPGLVARSVFPDDRGDPIFSAGTHFIDHTSPLSERWGGWYVTGDHGAMRHMGNVIAHELATGEVALDREAGANLRELPDWVEADAYLRQDSDIVALMVLEHQVAAHNAIFAAHFFARTTLHRNRTMAEHFGENPDTLSATTVRLLESEADALLGVMLMREEFELTGYGVEGNDAFQNAYAAGARRDADGRSLRDLQLLDRLFKFRCSPLIYSMAFANLPPEFRAIVLRRLSAILKGNFASPDQAANFAHLSDQERTAIREILAETLDDLPKDW